MKKLLLLLTITSLLSLPVTAKAEVPGCPNTWNLPNLSFDLPKADYDNYFAGNFNQIVKPGVTEFSFDNMNWQKTVAFFPTSFVGSIGNDVSTLISQRVRNLAVIGANPPYGEDQLVISNLSLLKNPEIYVRSSISIEKKGCSPQTFIFSGKYPMPKIENVDFNQQFSQIEGFFRDFKAAETAKGKYSSCINEWKSLAGKRDAVIPVERWCFIGSTFPIKDQADRSVSVYLIPFKDGCLSYYPGNSNRANGTQLVPGSDCQYAVVIGEDWKNFTNYSIDPEFMKKFLVTEVITIKSSAIAAKPSPLAKVLSTTCVKGKSKLIFSGKTAKCPPGYKKL